MRSEVISEVSERIDTISAKRPRAIRREERPMARTRGWSGNPPTDDDEARQRIIEATKRCLDRLGPSKTTLADVAVELDISRPTIYRYFTTTDSLLHAAAVASSHEFMTRVAAHLNGITAPDVLLAEAITFTLEQIPKDPYIGVFLQPARRDSTIAQIIDTPSYFLTRTVLAQLEIDWDSIGMTDEHMAELAEMLLRLFVSFLSYPDHTRTREQTRAFFQRWVGGTLKAIALTGT
jgi:AcrR family transcriptional regulator